MIHFFRFLIFYWSEFSKNLNNLLEILQIEPVRDGHGVGGGGGVEKYAESGEIELQMMHFFRFSWAYILKNLNNLLEISSNLAFSWWSWCCQGKINRIWWNRASDDPLFPFFPGHISRKIWTIFWKSLQMEPNLVKTSSKWSTFFVLSFFRFFWAYIWKNLNNFPNYLLIAPNLANFSSWWSNFFTFSKKSLGAGDRQIKVEGRIGRLGGWICIVP